MNLEDCRKHLHTLEQRGLEVVCLTCSALLTMEDSKNMMKISLEPTVDLEEGVTVGAALKIEF